MGPDYMWGRAPLADLPVQRRVHVQEQHRQRVPVQSRGEAGEVHWE